MQQTHIAELKNTYNTISSTLKGIRRYETLHRSYSSDMKMILLADKISLMLIAGNQFLQNEITIKINNAEKEAPIPEDLSKLFDKLRTDVDDAFDSILSDLKDLIGKMGNIDSLYERVD